VNNDDLVAELRSEFGQPSNGNDDLVAELRSELTGNRPIASLSGGIPPAPGFGDSIRIGIEQAAGFPEGTLDAVRRPLLTGLASAGGTVAGLASPVPGGAYLGGVAGGLAGDAFNNYLDGVPISEAVTPANVARGALYGTMRGRLLADTIKLAGGNAVIDKGPSMLRYLGLPIPEKYQDEPLSMERTLAQAAPALIAPGLRTAGTIGRFARDAKAGGLTEAMDKFQGTYKTPEQRALVDEMPELFPTRPTINVRGKQDILDEAGIVPGRTNPVLEEPKDGFWFRNVTQAQMDAKPELFSLIRYFKKRGYPSAVEAAKRMELANDLTREIRDTGKQITAEVLERLKPEERVQFHKYMSWRDMAQKDAWADEVRLAGKLKDAGDPSLESLVSTFDDETAKEWQSYDFFRSSERELTPAVRAAADEVRERLLSRLDQFNMVVGTRTHDPVTGEARNYMSAGDEYYPRVPQEKPPTHDPFREAILKGKMTEQEAGERILSGRSPATMEVGRRTWLRTPEEFSDNPQHTLDSYVDEQAKRIGRSVAFGDETSGTGADMAALIGTMRRDGHRIDADILTRNLDEIYNPNPRKEQLIGRLKRGVSNVALTLSAAAQIPQAATNVAQAGFGNTLKGMLRQRSEAKKFRLSAANSPATKEYFENVNEIKTSTMPSKAVGVIEQNWNRSNSAVGFGPHLRSLGQESLDHLDAGREFPARLVREASFYGVTPETLATHTRLFGEPAWTRPMRQAIKNAQFHVDPGEVGEGFRTGPTSVVTQYMSFPSLQAGYFKDQIASPMLSGNMGEFDLGLERLARLVPVSAALTLPTAWLTDVAKGRELSSPADIASRVAGNVAGLYAMPLSVAASVLGGDKYNSRMAERAAIPPIVGMAQNMSRDGGAALYGLRDGNLDPIAKFLLKDILPMANMSGTGLEGVVLPPAYKYLIERPR
jgi:hypothetical protein